KAGFVAWKPRGAYYILTDVAHFMKQYGVQDPTAFAMWLIKQVGVATVPGTSFYAHPELRRTKIRFCVPKTDDVLRDAGERLLKLSSRLRFRIKSPTRPINGPTRRPRRRPALLHTCARPLLAPLSQLPAGFGAGL